MPTRTTMRMLALAGAGFLVAASASGQSDGETHYVSPFGANIPPYLTWEDAAQNIQAAIDVALPGERVLVTNGLYNVGERPVHNMPNRIVITPGVRVHSVNGPEVTFIEGRGPIGSMAMRCAYLDDQSLLAGFTLINGHTFDDFDLLHRGGGAYCEPSAVVSNCVIKNCVAQRAGGVYGGRVFRTKITDNAATETGGGAIDSVLNNCLLTRNAALEVGAAENCLLINCTVVENGSQGTVGGTNISAGVRNCDVNNSVVVLNTLADLSVANFDGGVFRHSCVTPLPPGEGNIEDVPEFNAVVQTDGFQFEPGTLCINAGDNFFAQEPLDLDGNPRLRGPAVDIGAYEFFFEGEFILFLEGPYQPGTGRMSTHLVQQGLLPLTSPYTVDRLTVTNFPTNVVDWVLFEIREQPDSPARSSRSVFLLDDGRVVTETGSTTIDMETDPGVDYYVFIKHRNHMGAMSTVPLPFTTRRVTYDFSTDVSQYQDGAVVAVPVGAGVWASRGGDVNGIGSVNVLDVAMHQGQEQAGSVGYHRADVNLDGFVDVSDRAVILQAQGAASSVPRPEVRLSPSGRVSPPRRTLVEADSLVLTATNFVGPVTWAFEENLSGGTLDTNLGLQVTYTAGTNPGSVDVIQAWDNDDRLALSFLNIISSNDSAALGKAVIVAGGRDLQDRVWDATEYLTDKAYNTLRYRGFSRDLIQYLSFGPAHDVNGDGNATNDITFATADFDDVDWVFTNWVGSSGTDRLTVYMCDHGSSAGSNGQFRLNASQFLPASTLDRWLDDLQDADTNLHVTVVLDFCYAGSTLDELQYPTPDRRIVISSTAADELAYFISIGQISFSEFFWNGVLLGDNDLDAFELSESAMGTYQTPWLDDDQDGAYSNGVDGAFAATNYIGASFVAGKDFPIIGRVLENQVLARGSSATLWADDISSFYALDRVWCTITPPSFAPDPNTGTPVVDVTTRELTFNSATGRYETEFDGFTESGQYIVTFFARDIWDSVSPAKQTAVVQAGYLEKVILVTGGELGDPHWSAADATAHLAYQTFRSRLIASSNLYVVTASPFRDFDGDGSNDVDAANTVTNVQAAVQTWGDDADRLTVYLIGTGTTNDAFRLGAGEVIGGTSLDAWLDYHQRSNRTVNAILEFGGSGAFIPRLQPPAGEERYVFASCAPGRQQTLSEELSYSTFFLNEIFNGEPLGTASRRARKGIRRASGNMRQKGMVDDTNNGIPNEKNTDEVPSSGRFIGSPFFTGDDIPNIAEVTPATTTSVSSLLLYAAGVSDADGISNVWVEITAPTNYAGSISTRLDLTFNTSNDRWEQTYSGFVDPGIYALTFYAVDTISNESAGVQSQVLRTDTNNFQITDPTLPDPFEPDNTVSNAAYSDLPVIQVRSLHVSNDVDWVRFYATDDLVYDIETIHLDTNSFVDTTIRVYREERDGSLTLLDAVDEFGREEGELTGLDFPTNGFYLVRVGQAPNVEFSPGSYLLTVTVPAGLEGINVRVLDILTAVVMPNATVKLKNAGGSVIGTDTTDSGGYASFSSATAGTYRVEVIAAGSAGEYMKLFNPSSATQGPDNPGSDYGNERLVEGDDFGVISYGGITLAQTTYLTFGFLPVAYIVGDVENGLTGEMVAGAALGILRNSDSFVFSRYPWASYASPWLTDISGNFPTNVMVPPNMLMTPLVIRGGYSNYTHASSLTTPAKGQTLDVGTLVLSPTYGGNAIPDFWELSHGLATNVNVNLDPDGDSQTHLEEWIAGTDPNDGTSFFATTEVAETGTGYRLRWIGAPSRWYRVWRNPDLVNAGGWTSVLGPLQNGPAYVTAEWTDTTVTNANNYRIEVWEP